MTVSRTPEELELDEIVCGGIATDVFLADQARYLLEELDRFVEDINRTGTGKLFFASLQGIIQRELILSVTRLYEPFSPRNPGRTIPAAAQHIRAHSAKLRTSNRQRLITFLGRCGKCRDSIESCGRGDLSAVLVEHLTEDLPRSDSASTRPLDQVLARLKMVRDKAIAHHDRVDKSSLMVPGWTHLVDLIGEAREVVESIASAYLNVGYNLKSDARQAAASLRRLLSQVGLAPEPPLSESNVG